MRCLRINAGGLGSSHEFPKRCAGAEESATLNMEEQHMNVRPGKAESHVCKSVLTIGNQKSFRYLDISVEIGVRLFTYGRQMNVCAVLLNSLLAKV